MPGLPFVSLNEAENPEDRTMIERQNATVQRNLAEMRTGSQPWVEIAPAPSQPTAQTLGNPLDILTADSKTALDTVLGQFKTKREALQKSIDPDIDLAYQKAMLDVEAVNNSDLDAAAKQQRVKDLETTYRKKKLDLQAKIRGDMEALDAAEQQAKSTAAMNMVLQQREVQLYQSLADSGKLDPSEAMSLQYKAVGKDVPASMLKAKDLSPKQALAEVVPVRQAFEREMDQYVMAPAKTSGSLFWKSTSPERLKVLKPEYRDNSKYSGLGYEGNEDLFQDATPEEVRRYYELKPYVSSLIEQERVYREQIMGRHIPTLAVARKSASPIAQSVAPRTVAADPNDVSKLSDAELRRIAGL